MLSPSLLKFTTWLKQRYCVNLSSETPWCGENYRHATTRNFAGVDRNATIYVFAVTVDDKLLSRSAVNGGEDRWFVSPLKELVKATLNAYLIQFMAMNRCSIR